MSYHAKFIQKYLDQETKYKTPIDFSKDVRLVFTNCYTYNMPGSDISNAAEELEQAFNEVHLKFNQEQCTSLTFYFVSLHHVIIIVSTKFLQRAAGLFRIDIFNFPAFDSYVEFQ